MGFSLNISVPAITVFVQGLLSFFHRACCRCCRCIWAISPAALTLYAYGITAFPTTFMIDREGNIYGYVTGALSLELMESVIDQTLAG